MGISAQWIKHIETWQCSDMSQAAYCAAWAQTQYLCQPRCQQFGNAN